MNWVSPSQLPASNNRVIGKHCVFKTSALIRNSAIYSAYLTKIISTPCISRTPLFKKKIGAEKCDLYMSKYGKNQISTLYGYCFMDICLFHWLKWKNSTLTHKIQKWGHSDLILGLPCNILLRCPHVWFGTLGPLIPKSICLFMCKLIDFHWKCLSLL